MYLSTSHAVWLCDCVTYLFISLNIHRMNCYLSAKQRITPAVHNVMDYGEILFKLQKVIFVEGRGVALLFFFKLNTWKMQNSGHLMFFKKILTNHVKIYFVLFDSWEEKNTAFCLLFHFTGVYINLDTAVDYFGFIR